MKLPLSVLVVVHTPGEVLLLQRAGAELERGQRFGFIRFGSRVDVYLPLDAQVNAAIGDKVYAAESVLAWLKPPTTIQK